MKNLPNNSLKKFVKIGEAAAKLGVSIDTLRRWEKTGKIETIRTPGGTRFYSTSTLTDITHTSKKYQRNAPSLPRPGLGGTNKAKVTTIEDLLNISRAEGKTEFKTPATDQKWQEYTDTRVAQPEAVTVMSEAELPVIASETKQSSTKIATGRSFDLRNDKNAGHKIYAFSIVSGSLIIIFLAFLLLAKGSSYNFSIGKWQVANGNGQVANSQKQSATSNKPLALGSNVLAASTDNYILDLNSDFIVEGDLAVGGTINKLTLTPQEDGFTIAGGDPTSRTLTVTGGDVTLDQDVSTNGSPSFLALTLPTTTGQISLGGLQTITLPNATGTVLLDSATQTITNKTISGSSNTFSSIPNSALSNNKITISAGTNLSGGGDISLGSSGTLSLKDDVSLTTVTASSYLSLGQTTAPTTTTDKLYNVLGTLYWNGTDIGSGGAPPGTNGQTLYYNDTTLTATSNLFNNGTNVGIGTQVPGAILDVRSSFANSSTAQTYNIFGQASVTDGETTNSPFVDGGYLESNFSGTDTQYGIRGLDARAYNSSTGTVSRAFGAFDFAQNTNSGIITSAAGTLSRVVNYGTGTINSGALFYGTTSNGNASGTIGTLYGLRLDSWENLGTVDTSYGIYMNSSIDVGTTRYALYSSSTSDSYFAGDVGIGTTNPGFTLDVNGIVNATALYVNGNPYIGSQWTTATPNIYYNTGSVGIGTTNPASFALEVGGNIGPEANNTRDLGAVDKYFANAYITNLVSGTIGTVGYWTRAGTSLSPSNSGDSITTTGTISTTGSGTLSVAGAATFSSTINSNTLTSTALTFAGTTPVISASTAATDISLNPGAGGNVLLAGGSASYGCSVNDTTGDLTCTGAITSGGTGVVGYWQTDGGSPPTLSPATTGGHITTSGNMYTSGTGTITSGGLLTGQTGLTVSGGATSLNTSSNYDTSINTGTSTGTISIGNSAAGAITLQSGAASTFHAPVNTATAFRLTDGTNPYLTLDTRNTISGVSALTLAAGTAPTIASASNAEYTTLTTTPPTITLTGSTQVTNQMDSTIFNAPTITDASAITVDKVATLTIAGAPISGASGSVTLTDSYALKINTASVDSGTGTVTNAHGLYVEAPTGATNNYGVTVTADSISTGKGLNLTSTSTSLSSGSLASFDWSPTGSTNIYATGDLVSISTGNAYAFVGNLLNIKSQGSSVFSVSDTAVTTSLPAAFNSPGDVTIAYDINMTNPTASYIKSAAPLYLQAGETFNASDLSLNTYHEGSVILNQDNQTTAAGTSYALQVLPNLTSSTNSLTYTALYGTYTVPTVNMSGNAAVDLTTAYGNYSGLTATAGTITNWYANYVAAPTGSGTVTNKYAFVSEATAGNVGIGTTAPAALFTVGNNLFEINSSGFALLPDGAVTTPSLSFVADPNTGIWRSGSDVLNFSTGGTERMRIDAAGEIGIGTTATAAFLSLNAYSGYASNLLNLALNGTTLASVSNAGLLQVFDTGGTKSLNLSHDGTNGVITASSGDINLGSGGGTLFLETDIQNDGANNGGYVQVTDTLTVTGNVGIGTTVPVTLLDVNQKLNVLSGGNVGIGTTNPGAALEIGGSGNVMIGGLTASQGVYTDSNKQLTSTAPTTGTLGYWQRNSTFVSPATISDSIGIGTTSPAGKLDVTDTSNTAASLSLTNNTATTIGAGINTLGVIDLQSTSLTTGNFLNLEVNALSSGKGMNLTSTSTALSSGSLASFDWSPTGSTNIYATGDLVSISTGNAYAFVGNLLNIKSQGSSVFSVSDTAVTSNLPASFTAPGDVSVAYDLNFTNPTASYIKSGAPLYITSGKVYNSSDLVLSTYNQGSIVLTKDFTSTTAVTNYLSQISGSDITAIANTNYGLYSSITHTGNAAKTGVGLYSTLSTSSTTADTLIAADLATSTTGIMTTGTRNIYGLRSQPASTAASTGGTTNVYGEYIKSGGVVGVGGTINNYGLYVANGTMDTTGLSTNTGLYVETPTGADTNYAAIFAGGNVGIGTTAPGALIGLAQGTTAANGINFGGDATLYRAGASTLQTDGTFIMNAAVVPSIYGGYSASANLTLDSTVDVTKGYIILAPSGGNVGIGTTSPGAALELGTGNIKFKGDDAHDGSGQNTLIAYGSDPFVWTDGWGNLKFEAKDNQSLGLEVSGYGDFYLKDNSASRNVIQYCNSSCGVNGGLLRLQPTGGNVAIGTSVGIGTTAPAHTLDVVGDAGLSTGTLWTNTSDAKVKQNIEAIPDALGLINQLKPSQYQYTPEYLAKHPEIKNIEHFGFIAQDFQQIFPDSVNTGADGFLQVNASNVIPYMTKAIQELSNQVNSYNLTFDSNGNVVLPAVKMDKLIIASDIPFNGSTSTTNYFDVAAVIDEQIASNKLQDTNILGLETQVASNSATLSSHETALESLRAEIASLSAQLSSSSSTSGEPKLTPEVSSSSGQTSPDVGFEDRQVASSAYSSGVSLLNLTPPSILLATTSAQLVDLSVSSDATISGRLVSYDLSVQDTLKSLGETFLGKTTIAGDFSVDGTMSLTGSSINSLACHPEGTEGSNLDSSLITQNDNCGVLFLQNSPLAQGVDFFNGQVVIDKTGKLTAQKIALPTEVLGEAIIPANTLEIPVFTAAITNKSKVFLTPSSSTGGQAIILGEIVPGTGFVAKLDHTFEANIKFNWLIMDSQ